MSLLTVNGDPTQILDAESPAFAQFSMPSPFEKAQIAPAKKLSPAPVVLTILARTAGNFPLTSLLE